jgi:hypothetical protein
MIALLVNPVTRWGIIAALGLAALGGAYTKGRLDGSALCQLKGQADVLDVIKRAQEARDRVRLGPADDGLPDTFRRD